MAEKKGEKEKDAEKKNDAATAEGEGGEGGEQKSKFKRALPVLGPILGLAIGAGGAVGYFKFLAPPPEAAPAETEVVEEPKAELPDELMFVKLERLTVPLINADRRVIGYVHMDLNLEVDGEHNEQLVRRELPIVKHAVNSALSLTGAGSADNPRLIDYDGTAKRIMEVANEALSEPVITKVHIVSARPI